MSKDKQTNGGGAIIGVIITSLLLWGGYNLFFAPSGWQLVYEARNGDIVASSTYDTQEACLEALHESGYNGECGRGCKEPATANGPWRCDETVD